MHALFAMAMYVIAIGLLVWTNTQHQFATVWLLDMVSSNCSSSNSSNVETFK